MTQPTLLACASCCPDEDLCQMPLRSPSDWPMRAWHRAPQPSMWHNPVRNTVRVPNPTVGQGHGTGAWRRACYAHALREYCVPSTYALSTGHGDIHARSRSARLRFRPTPHRAVGSALEESDSRARGPREANLRFFSLVRTSGWGANAIKVPF